LTQTSFVPPLVAVCIRSDAVSVPLKSTTLPSNPEHARNPVRRGDRTEERLVERAVAGRDRRVYGEIERGVHRDLDVL